jgi:hypothetical protein
VQTLRDAEEHVEAPRSTFKESRPPRQFPSYMALMSDIIYSEPTIVDDVTSPLYSLI